MNAPVVSLDAVYSPSGRSVGQVLVVMSVAAEGWAVGSAVLNARRAIAAMVAVLNCILRRFLKNVGDLVLLIWRTLGFKGVMEGRKGLWLGLWLFVDGKISTMRNVFAR